MPIQVNKCIILALKSKDFKQSTNGENQVKIINPNKLNDLNYTYRNSNIKIIKKDQLGVRARSAANSRNTNNSTNNIISNLTLYKK